MSQSPPKKKGNSRADAEKSPETALAGQGGDDTADSSVTLPETDETPDAAKIPAHEGPVYALVEVPESPVSPLVLAENLEAKYMRHGGVRHAARYAALAARLGSLKTILREFSDDEANDMGLLSLKKGL